MASYYYYYYYFFFMFFSSSSSYYSYYHDYYSAPRMSGSHPVDIRNASIATLVIFASMSDISACASELICTITRTIRWATSSGRTDKCRSPLGRSTKTGGAAINSDNHATGTALPSMGGRGCVATHS